MSVKSRVAVSFSLNSCTNWPIESGALTMTAPLSIVSRPFARAPPTYQRVISIPYPSNLYIISIITDNFTFNWKITRSTGFHRCKKAEGNRMSMAGGKSGKSDCLWFELREKKKKEEREKNCNFRVTTIFWIRIRELLVNALRAFSFFHADLLSLCGYKLFIDLNGAKT